MDINQYVIFKLGAENSEKFAIEITNVEQVIKSQQITQLPKTDDSIEGVINLRGETIIIVDLRKQLNYTTDKDKERIIIVNIDDTKVGCVVNDASQVKKIKQEQVSDPIQKSFGLETDFIKGIAKSDDELIILLDVNELLSITKEVEIDENIEHR